MEGYEAEINDVKPKQKKWYLKCLTWGVLLDISLIISIVVFIECSLRGLIPYAKFGFYCGDPAISHRFIRDTISDNALVSSTVLIPIMIFILVEKLRSDGSAPWQKIWLWYSVHLISFITYCLCAQLLKLSLAIPRPHFLHTCAPDTALNCTKGEYITEYTCLNTGGFDMYTVHDSSMSFPSGHAGIATLAGSFCAIYIQERFQLRHQGKLLKPVFATVVFTLGLLVGITRVLDHRHREWDVIAGMALGIPFLFYKLHFCNYFKVGNKVIKIMHNDAEKPIYLSGQIERNI